MIHLLDYIQAHARKLSHVHAQEQIRLEQNLGVLLVCFLYWKNFEHKMHHRNVNWRSKYYLFWPWSCTILEMDIINSEIEASYETET